MVRNLNARKQSRQAEYDRLGLCHAGPGRKCPTKLL
jgi:hypothetical protein